jgi:hypothetical protein
MLLCVSKRVINRFEIPLRAQIALALLLAAVRPWRILNPQKFDCENIPPGYFLRSG